MEHLFVASCDQEGGILSFCLDEEGSLKLTGRTPLDRPMYLCSEGSTVYALLREPFWQQSGVVKLQINPEGTLTQLGPVCPTNGSISCHILSFAGHIYTANYMSGSVTRLPDRVMSFPDRGNRPQQARSHPHCLTPTPDEKYICICDLGTDCIYIVNEELEEVSRTRVKPGSGPRHLVFSKHTGYGYCINELSSELSVFSYQGGKLTLLGSERCIPEDFATMNYPSAIRLNSQGTRLYTANRGHESVCIWDVEKDRLSGRRFVGTGGSMPREMNVIGRWLLCGNNECLTVVSEDTGMVTDRVMIKKPWCILPVKV